MGTCSQMHRLHRSDPQQGSINLQSGTSSLKQVSSFWGCMFHIFSSSLPEHHWLQLGLPTVPKTMPNIKASIWKKQGQTFDLSTFWIKNKPLRIFQALNPGRGIFTMHTPEKAEARTVADMLSEEPGEYCLWDHFARSEVANRLFEIIIKPGFIFKPLLAIHFLSICIPMKGPLFWPVKFKFRVHQASYHQYEAIRNQVLFVFKSWFEKNPPGSNKTQADQLTHASSGTHVHIHVVHRHCHLWGCGGCCTSGHGLPKAVSFGGLGMAGKASLWYRLFFCL